MFAFIDNWSGLIFVFVGIYLLLMAYRIIPKKPKDPEKMEIWHKKFGKMVKIIGPLLIIFGILELLGIF